jgi:hypothetical protein
MQEEEEAEATLIQVLVQEELEVLGVVEQEDKLQEIHLLMV